MRNGPDCRIWRLTIAGAAARGCVMGSGGELEQIQFLLGHASVQTTERYIGYEQRLREAVNNGLGIALSGVDG